MCGCMAKIRCRTTESLGSTSSQSDAPRSEGWVAPVLKWSGEKHRNQNKGAYELAHGETVPSVNQLFKLKADIGSLNRKQPTIFFRRLYNYVSTDN